MQKELKQLLKIIGDWTKANKNNVTFIGSFVSFDENKKDEDDAVKDNIVIGYGKKNLIKLQLEELSDYLSKEKDNFINW